MPPGNPNTPRHEGKGCWNGEHEVPYSATRSSVFSPRGHSPQCSLPERLRQTTYSTYLGVQFAFACLIIGYRHSRLGDQTPQAPAEREGVAKVHAWAETGHEGESCPPAMSLPTPNVERIRTPRVQAVSGSCCRPKSRVASFNSTQTRRCWKTKRGGVDTAQFEVTTSDVGIMTHIAQVSNRVGPCATACDP